MLDNQALADLMKSKVNAITANIPASYQDAYFLALASAIVEHIQSNADVYSGICTPSGPIKEGKVR